MLYSFPFPLAFLVSLAQINLFCYSDLLEKHYGLAKKTYTGSSRNRIAPWVLLSATLFEFDSKYAYRKYFGYRSSLRTQTSSCDMILQCFEYSAFCPGSSFDVDGVGLVYSMPLSPMGSGKSSCVWDFIRASRRVSNSDGG